MSSGVSCAHEKASRQEQRDEWVEMLKLSPINDARGKHAIEPGLSLPKEHGALHCSGAPETLVLQGWLGLGGLTIRDVASLVTTAP